MAVCSARTVIFSWVAILFCKATWTAFPVASAAWTIRGNRVARLFDQRKGTVLVPVEVHLGLPDQELLQKPWPIFRKDLDRGLVAVAGAGESDVLGQEFRGVVRAFEDDPALGVVGVGLLGVPGKGDHRHIHSCVRQFQGRRGTRDP